MMRTVRNILWIWRTVLNFWTIPNVFTRTRSDDINHFFLSLLSSVFIFFDLLHLASVSLCIACIPLCTVGIALFIPSISVNWPWFELTDCSQTQTVHFNWIPSNLINFKLYKYFCSQEANAKSGLQLSNEALNTKLATDKYQDKSGQHSNWLSVN